MTTEYKKPVPRPADPELTKPFWEAAKRHELMLQRCKICDSFFWYPRQVCPECLRTDIEWARVSGKGRVHSWTVPRRPAHPGFKDDIPYIYALIQLDEGPRMESNLVECSLEDVKMNMPVTAVFDDITPEWTLVKFKPV